ncbi:MAG: CD3324 family protein [Eubacteriales bacterium]|nr:CD3324 family protein [Clostridia bacterium]
MGYRNGKDVLPEKLLKELQNYIQGELIYIPKKDRARAGWGEINGTRQLIRKRNLEIYRQYSRGLSVKDLVTSYHLSEDSIRKIVSKMQRDLLASSK